MESQFTEWAGSACVADPSPNGEVCRRGPAALSSRQCISPTFHTGGGFLSQLRIATRVTVQSSSCSSRSFHQGGSHPKETSWSIVISSLPWRMVDRSLYIWLRREAREAPGA